MQFKTLPFLHKQFITVNNMMSNLNICIAHQYYSGCEMKKRWMGGEWRIYVLEGRFIQD